MNQRQTENPIVRAREFWQCIYLQRWLVLLGIVLLTAISIVVVSLLPNYYQASTVVLFNPQMLPDRYVTPTVTSDPAQRVTTLTEELLSSSRLFQVAREVFPDQTEMGANIEAMRKNITIDMKPSPDRDMTAFVINYTAKNAHIAALVTNRLADSFIHWDLQEREQQAEATTEFLRSQLQEAHQSLEQEQDKLTAFKRSHPGELPDDLQTNSQALYRIQAALQENKEHIERLQQEKLSLTGPDAGRVPLDSLSDRARLTLEQNNLQNQLNDLRSQYTDSYPDVVAINERQRAVAQQLKELPPDSKDSNPAGTRLNWIEQQLQQLDVEQKTLSAQMGSYQTKMNAAPALGQEGEALTRDYESAKQEYEALLDKQFQASMATELQRQQGNGRFVVEPARVPQVPIKPNRLLLFAAGILMSLVLPPLLAIAWPEIRGTIDSGQSLRQLLPSFATLVSEIPNMPSSSDRQSERRIAIFSMLGSAVTVVGIIAFLWIVRPYV